MNKESKPKIVAISGPDGAGKGYLTDQVIQVLGLTEKAMLTTRPSRGLSETKKPVGIKEYNLLLVEGRLVGHHENKGNFYAFLADDFKDLETNGIIELNPALQPDTPKELRKRGIDFVGWIGLEAELDYLSGNIKSRTLKDTSKEVDPKVLEAKLDMAKTIMDWQNKLISEGTMTRFKVGWHNRTTMGQEICQIIANMMGIKM